MSALSIKKVKPNQASFASGELRPDKNDKIDSYKIALLLKGGNFPTAYPYPAKWRATRDLLRRRMYISRRCSELIAHIQNTNTQYTPLADWLLEKICHENTTMMFVFCPFSE